MEAFTDRKGKLSTYFDDNQAKGDHGRRSLRSGVVSVTARGVNIVIQVGSTIFLARLLSPHDYGLVGMVSALVGFAPTLIDLGTTDAAVQKSRISRDEVSALFWLNVGIGGGLSVLVAACSPLIARFYHEPELQRIALVSSLTFIFSALSCQHYALLRRAMMFRRIAMIDIGANLFSSGLAIGMAFCGSGYWALVVRSILVAFFLTVGVWWECRWLPGLPKLTSGVKDMLKFGAHLTGFTMTDYAARSGDRVAIGYWYGAGQLGFYQNALMLYENVLSVLTVPLHTVATASLTKLREDIEELKRCWATALASLSFFAMPAFGILAVTGPDAVVLLLGDKWAKAGSLLSIFAFRGIAHIVERTLGWLHVAAGRSDRWLRWGVASSLVQLAALGCGLPFGLRGVAIAYTVSTYVLFVPAISYAGSPFGIGPASVIKTVGPQLAGSLCSAVAGFWIRDTFLTGDSRLVRIVTLALTCTVLYLLVVVGLFRVTRPLQIARSAVGAFTPAPFSRLGRLVFRGTTPARKPKPTILP